MRRALVHRPSPELRDCELTYLDPAPIDAVLAARQHAGYVDLLRRHGFVVDVLEGNLHLPDAVFVEDTAVVLDEVAILTPMGVASRAPETELIASALASHRRLVRIDAPAKLEGGDVLRVGRRLFVGQGTRTDAAGLLALAAAVEPLGYEVTGVEVTGCLHLKTGCTALDGETLLIHSDWVDPTPFADFRRLEVPRTEPFAANTLDVGDAVALPSSFPATRALLEAEGYRVETVDISEFQKAEAGLTCMGLCFGAGDGPIR
ncbi:MAG: arginine deiminase family protein [Acidobacteriota bacterium]